MDSVEVGPPIAAAGRAPWWRLAAALVPAYPVIVLLADGRTLLPFKIETALVLLVTAARPPFGLLAVAALAPLGDMLMPLLGGRPLAHAETLVLAFLAAWLASSATESRSPKSVDSGASLAIWTFGALVAASALSTAYQLHQASPADLAQLGRWLRDGYLTTPDGLGVRTAANLLEALALLVASAELARRHPALRRTLPMTLVAAGLAGVAGSALLARGVAPAATRVRLALSELPRYSATVGDVNAAASWYVLLAGIAGGVAAARRGAGRVAWLAAAAWLGFGIWLTGSRAGIVAAAALVCGAAALWILRAGHRVAAALAAVVVAGGLVGIVALAATRSSESSLGMRAGFTEASWRMIEARPAFGVGIGRYYALSEFVMPPPLGWFYGRENAHDYYLQTFAELGIVGGLAFLTLLAAALARPVAAAWRARDTAVAGLAGGCLAYLVTALTGHPLLTVETAMPFWLALGVLCAGTAPARRTVHAAGVLIAAALLFTVPLRPPPPHLSLGAGEDGLGPAQVDAHGHTFREGGLFTSVVVGPRVTHVRIPLQLSAGTSLEQISVGVAAAQGPVYPVVIGHHWYSLDVALPGAAPLIRGQRINIHLFPPPQADARLDVGPITIAAMQ